MTTPSTAKFGGLPGGMTFDGHRSLDRREDVELFARRDATRGLLRFRSAAIASPRRTDVSVTPGGGLSTGGVVSSAAEVGVAVLGVFRSRAERHGALVQKRWRALVRTCGTNRATLDWRDFVLSSLVQNERHLCLKQ